MKTILLTLALIIFIIVIWKLSEPQDKAYNKYMCANYGYYSDCKTPLKPEDRLK